MLKERRAKIMFDDSQDRLHIVQGFCLGDGVELVDRRVVIVRGVDERVFRNSSRSLDGQFCSQSFSDNVA